MYAVFCSNCHCIRGMFLGLTESLATLKEYLEKSYTHGPITLERIGKQRKWHEDELWIEVTPWLHIDTEWALGIALDCGHEYEMGDVHECEPEYYLLMVAETL